MSTVERLADLATPPAVGRAYLVPCLVLSDGVRAALGADALPVLGPAHSDPSFAPELGHHEHYDPRFMDERHVRVRVDGLRPEQVMMVIAHRVRPGDRVEEREVVCLREMPAFPRWHEAAPWVPHLEAQYIGCRVRDGRCPHAGTCGRSFPRAPDGSWECIHGLRWAADGSPAWLPPLDHADLAAAQEAVRDQLSQMLGPGFRCDDAGALAPAEAARVEAELCAAVRAHAAQPRVRVRVDRQHDVLRTREVRYYLVPIQT